MRRDPRFQEGVPRSILDFRVDGDGHWVALLECGHTQHVRHDPPWQNREWVLSSAGRRDHLGSTLLCAVCVEEGEKR